MLKQFILKAKDVAAHIVAYHQPKRPASSYLFNQHRLPIKHRINFKIATLTLATGQPGYLINLLNTYQHVRSLRSQTFTSIGRCAFSYAAFQIWIDIPLNIRISPSVSSFKHNLKSTLFCCCFLTLPCATCSDCPRLRFCQLTDTVRVTNFCIVLYCAHV